MEAPVSLSGTFGGAFFTAGVFATTASYTRRIVQPTAAIVAFALFAMRDNPQSNTEK
jgi:MFS-type transporter involved in bile tolerance (Atg22 family)